MIDEHEYQIQRINTIQDNWAAMDVERRIELIKVIEPSLSIFGARRDTIPMESCGELEQYLEDCHTYY